MSNLITWESSALLTSLFWGMVLAAEYDCIRIFRRIVRHKRVWSMALEDILFWINAGITMFCIIYEINDGIIRGFSFAGFILGAILYKFAFGRFFVKYISKGILFILKPLKKFFRLIKIGIKKVLQLVFGPFSVLFRNLKKERIERKAKKEEQAKRAQQEEQRKAEGR
jgi:spore cortex biosynthesis protein YabQ